MMDGQVVLLAELCRPAEFCQKPAVARQLPNRVWQKLAELKVTWYTLSRSMAKMKMLFSSSKSWVRGHSLLFLLEILQSPRIIMTKPTVCSHQTMIMIKCMSDTGKCRPKIGACYRQKMTLLPQCQRQLPMTNR